MNYTFSSILCILFQIYLLQAMCEAVLFYAQLVHQRLKDSGFFEDVSAFKTSDEVLSNI